MERRPQTIHLDEICGRNPRITRATFAADQRPRTLVPVSWRCWRACDGHRPGDGSRLLRASRRSQALPRMTMPSRRGWAACAPSTSSPLSARAAPGGHRRRPTSRSFVNWVFAAPRTCSVGGAGPGKRLGQRVLWDAIVDAAGPHGHEVVALTARLLDYTNLASYQLEKASGRLFARSDGSGQAVAMGFEPDANYVVVAVGLVTQPADPGSLTPLSGALERRA